MRSPNDELVKDNAVILFSLLVARFQVARSTVYPPRIKSALQRRISALIKRYKNPASGISYDDPEPEERYAG